MIEYLTTELGSASVKDVEKKIVDGFKKLWKGGPEHRAAEIRDIAAAVTALTNFTIFEHPALFRLLTNAAGAGNRNRGQSTNLDRQARGNVATLYVCRTAFVLP